MLRYRSRQRVHQRLEFDGFSGMPTLSMGGEGPISVRLISEEGFVYYNIAADSLRIFYAVA